MQGGAALGALLVGRLAHSPKLAQLGGDLVRAQIVSGTITLGLKLAVGRARPDGTPLSFPSGHTSASFATATVLTRHFGWKVGVPACALATYIGASRMQENKHFASDVLFGAAVGIAAGRAVTFDHGRKHVAVAPFVDPVASVSPSWAWAIDHQTDEERGMPTNARVLGSLFSVIALLTVGRPTRAGQLPAGLKALEESSEKVSEVASDASQLKAALITLERDHEAAAAELAKAEAPAAVRESLRAGLARVKEAAGRGNANATGSAATTLMLAVADAFDVFHPGRPTDLLRLDAFAVRVPLDIASGHREDATAHGALLARAWDRLRPRLGAGSASTATAMTREVAGLRSAIANGSDAAVLSSARAIEDLVDELEKGFPEA